MSALTKGRRPGEPIVVLIVLVGLWVGGRSVLWQSPFPAVLEQFDIPAILADASEVDSAPLIGELRPAEAMPQDSSNPDRWARLAPMQSSLTFRPLLSDTGKSQPYASPRTLASHHVMWMAALSYVPVTPEVSQLIARAQTSPRAAAGIGSEVPANKADRWTLDAWALWRPQSSAITGAGPLPPAYGASQTGAVLRYQLAPNSHHQPSAHLRATKALSGGRESELAAGLSARPIAQLPVSAHVELRATRVAGGTSVRPAAFAMTEFAPQQLPFKAQLSSYAQAGYVGGDFATPFVDGQARMDRELASFDLATIRAGAGLWGGAQKDAGRFDIGPTASVDIELGGAPARISMDYRHRVAGDAEPQSGIAITLSTSL